MTTGSKDEPEAESVDEAAARWMGRKLSGEMTEAEAAALGEWLAADPSHLAAFAEYEQIIELTDPSKSVMAAAEQTRRKKAGGKKTNRRDQDKETTRRDSLRPL